MAKIDYTPCLSCPEASCPMAELRDRIPAEDFSGVVRAVKEAAFHLASEKNRQAVVEDIPRYKTLLRDVELLKAKNSSFKFPPLDISIAPTAWGYVMDAWVELLKRSPHAGKKKLCLDWGIGTLKKALKPFMSERQICAFIEWCFQRWGHDEADRGTIRQRVYRSGDKRGVRKPTCVPMQEPSGDVTSGKKRRRQ